MEKYFFYCCLLALPYIIIDGKALALTSPLEPRTLYPQSSLADMQQNWISHPVNQWSYKHISEIFKTAIISNKNKPEIKLLKKRNISLNSIFFQNFGGKKNSVSQWLKTSNTDAFIVLQKGNIFYESYSNDSDSDTLHQMFSVTKSFVGTLASALCAEKRLNPKKKVSDYIPELKKTAYHDVSVQELMDMRVAFNNYNEDYEDKSSFFHKYTDSVIADIHANAEFHSLRSYLVNLKSSKKDGSAFNYATVNTDVLAWVLEKVTNKKIQDLMSERIWSKIGTSSNAYMIADNRGVGWAGAGLNATLRDLAKFGQMMLQEGSFNKKQIIPKNAVKEIESGGDKKAFAKSADSNVFKGFSYKNQWWISHDENKSYMAIGIHGQWIYIDPTADVVIVKQSTLKEADTDENAHNAYKAMSAIAHSFIR